MTAEQGLGKAIAMENARFIARTALTGSLQNVGTPLLFPAKSVLVKNSTNQTVIVSHNAGVNTSFRLPPNSADSITEEDLFMPQGSQFQAAHSGVVPTSGEVIVEAIHVKVS